MLAVSLPYPRHDKGEQDNEGNTGNYTGSNGSELKPRAGFRESAFPIDGISWNCQPQPYAPQMSRCRFPDRRGAFLHGAAKL
jgi:hypothetical protein